MLWAAGLLSPLLPHFLEHLAGQDMAVSIQVLTPRVCVCVWGGGPEVSGSLSFSTVAHMEET